MAKVGLERRWYCTRKRRTRSTSPCSMAWVIRAAEKGSRAEPEKGVDGVDGVEGGAEEWGGSEGEALVTPLLLLRSRSAIAVAASMLSPFSPLALSLAKLLLLWLLMLPPLEVMVLLRLLRPSLPPFGEKRVVPFPMPSVDDMSKLLLVLPPAPPA